MDPKTGKPFIDIVADAAGAEGHRRWTVQEALARLPGHRDRRVWFARALLRNSPMRKEAQEALPAGIGTPPRTW
ncbi:hypothetical protein QJS66_05345 [Kocuria rhizophila]|nr:hypothetical protein QJS66_05345 [Kocuria rhizophila]